MRSISHIFSIFFIIFLALSTCSAMADGIYIDNGNIIVNKNGAGSTQIDPNGITVNGNAGSTYIDPQGNIVVNGPAGTTYVNKNGNVQMNTDGSQYYVDNQGNNITVEDGNHQNQQYNVDSKGNVIYTNPNSQYNVNSGTVIYTNPDRKYYVDNSGSVTIKENSGSYSSSPGTPYVDSKGAYYINDIIYSNCDEFPESDYSAYGNQRQGKSGWEFICQGYTFNKPVVISNIVISTIIFRGNSSGEIGIKVLNDKYKTVFQEKNYKKAAGKTLPAGTYYFYPLINSKNTKDCTLRLFIDKKN